MRISALSWHAHGVNEGVFGAIVGTILVSESTVPRGISTASRICSGSQQVRNRGSYPQRSLEVEPKMIVTG